MAPKATVLTHRSDELTPSAFRALLIESSPLTVRLPKDGALEIYTDQVMGAGPTHLLLGVVYGVDRDGEGYTAIAYAEPVGTGSSSSFNPPPGFESTAAAKFFLAVGADMEDGESVEELTDWTASRAGLLIYFGRNEAVNVALPPGVSLSSLSWEPDIDRFVIDVPGFEVGAYELNPNTKTPLRWRKSRDYLEHLASSLPEGVVSGDVSWRGEVGSVRVPGFDGVAFVFRGAAVEPHWVPTDAYTAHLEPAAPSAPPPAPQAAAPA
jgi:hypothetical protein